MNRKEWLVFLNVEEKLNQFLEERKDKFPKVSKEQKEKWIKDIEKQIIMMLDDNDIFYDNMPNDVEEC